MSIDRLLAIIGAVLGVVGLFAGWYFYRASLPARTPTFLVVTLRAVLAGGSGAETSDITVQYKGTTIGKKALNVVRVYFWNAGNTPITKAEIRDPLTITVSGDSEILDAKILKVNRDITFITFDALKNKRNTAVLNFELLESNDGAALQITYAGPKDAKLEFHGATIGAPSPTIVAVTDYSQELFKRWLSPLEEAVSAYKNVVSVVFFGLVLSVFLTILIPFARNLVYRRIFRSNKSNDEIEASAMRLLPPATVVLMVLGFIFLAFVPPKVTGVIPPALIVKDLIL